jgi:hypothetical protein
MFSHSAFQTWETKTGPSAVVLSGNYLVVAEGRRVVLAADDAEEIGDVRLRVSVVDGHRQVGAYQAVVTLEARRAVRVGRRAVGAARGPEVDRAGRRRLLDEVAVVYVEVKRAGVGDHRPALLRLARVVDALDIEAAGQRVLGRAALQEIGDLAHHLEGDPVLGQRQRRIARAARGRQDAEQAAAAHEEPE